MSTETQQPHELDKFQVWWNYHGQYCRSGGGEYEECFAWAAWQASQASQAAELAALKADIAEYVRITTAEQATEIEALRRLLCGVYAGFSSYTDDGEASDASRFPFIDFLRDPVDQIEAKMRERAFARVAAMQTKEAS